MRAARLAQTLMLRLRPAPGARAALPCSSGGRGRVWAREPVLAHWPCRAPPALRLRRPHTTAAAAAAASTAAPPAPTATPMPPP